MNRRILVFTVLVLASLLSSATTVKVSLDKNEFTLGERVKIHLEVHPTEEVGGQLVIRKIEGRRYLLVKQPYSKPSPSQCQSCAGGTPLRSDLSDDFYITPKETGTYNVEANFGGVRDNLNFTVTVEETTTVSTTLPTTTTTAPSTSIIVQTTTTLKPETSSTLNIAIPEREKEYSKEGLLVYLAVGLLGLFALAAILLTLFFILRSKRKGF